MTLPEWAEWNGDSAQQPWTVGLEEELMLLDPLDLTLASRSRDVLDQLPPGLDGRAFEETHACALELTTGPHRTVSAAASELQALREALKDVLDPLGLRAAAAGTHPLAVWQDIEISSGERYRHIHESMRELARREPTFALHVHVAVPGPELAVRALRGIREDLPLLLALSANSPYWQGRDTGLAATRIPVLSMFPRVAIPPDVATYGEYVAAVELLTASGAVHDPSYIWWDARLRPHLGTIEVRIMDAQTRVPQTAVLAALVQCLVRRHAAVPTASPLTAEALAENRFCAVRDGITAQFIRADPPRLQRATDRLARVLWDCAPAAEELGCSRELDGSAALVVESGHLRQRLTGAADGLQAVVAELAAGFARVPRADVRRAPSPRPPTARDPAAASS